MLLGSCQVLRVLLYCLAGLNSRSAWPIMVTMESWFSSSTEGFHLGSGSFKRPQLLWAYKLTLENRVDSFLG